MNNILFNITKKVTEDGYIIKKIAFTHRGRPYCYREKVKAIRRFEFLNFFEMARPFLPRGIWSLPSERLSEGSIGQDDICG